LRQGSTQLLPTQNHGGRSAATPPIHLQFYTADLGASNPDLSELFQKNIALSEGLFEPFMKLWAFSDYLNSPAYTGQVYYKPLSILRNKKIGYGPFDRAKASYLPHCLDDR
jgi:hypothetical protein